MINVVEQKKPFKDEIGDILYAEKYFKDRVELKWLEELELIYLPELMFQSTITWNNFKLLEIDIKALMKECMYICPWTGNKYFWFYPMLVMTDDLDKYKPKDTNPIEYKMWFDSEWTRSMYLNLEPSESRHADFLKVGDIVSSFLGHGHTDCTLPSDGNGDLDDLTVELDNGDLIVGKCWIWYNK